MKNFLLIGLFLFSFSTATDAQAQASLSFDPAQTSFQFDASGNLTFSLVPEGVTTTIETCRIKFLLATKEAPLNKGKIKNAASAPEGALVLFSVTSPAALPNSTLTVTTTGLASKLKKGNLYGRAALQCGSKKKTFVFSPIVSFDHSLMTNATTKAAPQVARELKSKTVTAF